MGRDLGKMGELAFGQMCASVGLTANRSLEADKTGWDYLVEFDFNSPSTPEISTIHYSALECKVQVKSTDKRNRKCSITLSNLKRLATATMPTFVLFIEFDGEPSAQRLFLVHFDQSLCDQVLRRLHDADQNGQSNRLHKQTMSIKYGQEHLLVEASGAALSAAIKRHVGTNPASYITKKIGDLSSAGFERGFAEMSFTAENDDQMNKLIDMSLGLQGEAEVSNVEAISKRFDIKGTVPFIKEKSLKISFPDLKPSHEGWFRFRRQKLGAPLSIPGELYISQFYSHVPHHFRKIRLKSEFFDFVINPYTGESTSTLRSPVEHMPLKLLRDGLKVCQWYCRSDPKFFLEIDMPSLPPLTLETRGEERPFELQTALDATEASLRVLSACDIDDDVQMSLAEAIQTSAKILQLEQVLNTNAVEYKFDFTMESELSLERPILFLTFYYTPIGDTLVGAIITLTGKLLVNGNKNYTMISEKKKIERILVRKRKEKVSVKDLTEAGLEIRRKYESEYEVVTSIDERKS